MVASVQNPSDIVNIALAKTGYKLRIGSLLDGSEAANRALDIYSQTRDEMQRTGNWGFVSRTIALTVLKQAPSGGYFPPNLWNPTDYPQLPYSFEYSYPDDCLKVRAVKPTSQFLFDPLPQPNLFAIANDEFVPGDESALATLLVNAAGTNNYAPNDTINLTGGVQTIPAQLVVASTKVVSATIAAGGTMGTPGAQTVTGTTGTGTKFTAGVTVSGGGVITSVNSISLAGVYTANPTNPNIEPVTGAGLTGATLNVKLGVNAITIFNPGVFTTESTTFTQATTSGTGTGATCNTATFTDLLETQRVILCNIPDAICVYAAQVTAPDEWDVDFVEAFAAALGRRLAPVLVGMNAVQPLAQEEAMSMAVAMREQG